MEPAVLIESWAILEDLRARGEPFPVREVPGVEYPSGRPLCAIGYDWARHLLIPLHDGDERLEDRHSAGVQIQVHALLDREQTRQFLDIVCLKPHLSQLFTTLAAEILDALSSDSHHPGRTSR